MNWDEYKAATKHIVEEFGKSMQKLEMDILLGVIDEQGKTSRRQDIENLIAEMFRLQDQLKSIKDSPETMMGVLSDILGLKGDRRTELMEKAKNIAAARERF